MPPTVSSPGLPRIWALGISRLQRAFAELIPAYSHLAEFRIVGRAYDSAADAIRREAREGKLDVVVSGGSNGAYLRQHVDVPVVLVKVTGFDVMSALATARRISPNVALVTHASTYAEVDEFTRAFSLSIPAYTYLTEDDATARVQTLKQEGVKVVVGPGLVTDLADRLGLIGVFLYSGNSVRMALEDAIEAARLRRIESGRRDYVNNILAHLNEGVAAVDGEGRIQSFNPAMERFLGTPAASAVGRKLQSLSPGLSLDDVIQTGAKELEAIQKVGDRMVVVNRIPLANESGTTGALLTLQDATAIQRVDRNLRSRSRTRLPGVRYSLEDLAGTSAAMMHVRELARRYASVDSTVLIGGESGTGKEVLAQGMHDASPRRAFPFVAVNCAAFPETLLESELFGYEEGAFTGARRGGKAGLFESAHNGTLFLDEVGDMPPALQTRLLRVLQEKQVLPIGGLEAVPVNVRVIAATHRDLVQRVSEGTFRQDLYYRLNILRIEVPPLRARAEDLPELAELLYRRALERLGLEDHEGLPQAARARLAGYHWPGNIRELENVTERIAVLVAGRPLEPAELLRELQAAVPELFGDDLGAMPDAAISVDEPVQEPMRGGRQRRVGRSLAGVAQASEAEHIRRVLAECGGDRNAACHILGISPTTLWRRLRAA
ncbi:MULTISPECIES: propionate catabolism operon regulatory protein PrpR [Cupriavidus]|uniref:PAS:Helix-turn-helix, Fis-type:Propionate catabolism activator, N-terminal n=1 Tax=Cupriavidus pinatubonensis (strain JMP 134 / LMG 1197) TaxID=264198 RepID=Q470L1_CUPPJ|nr:MULTISPECIES: propionate catabolism operon regulatory protein PrpR [Cupriavidus]QYY30022.1 propionate catabolism operon regulatory protein PrpR [Cupriavidus pinatubonensis]TPQ41072.1 propionate catabolism operon regulatory protein PrpR [Cupriavidus pinatubonensis]